MVDSDLRKTVRRCTAVLAVLLSLLVVLLQGYLAYHGLENDLRNVWLLARVLSFASLTGGLLYLTGSLGLSAYRAVS
ncbi:MAG: hypothetical protein ABEJ30_08385 [Halorientalis sp.]